MLGSVQSGVVIKYSDPCVTLKFPFTYNSNFSDDFSADYTANSIPAKKTGTVTTTYDGYGTLKTVYGTFKNVVRLKQVRTDQDVSSFMGEVLGTSKVVSTVYGWYLPGSSQGLFAVSKTETTLIDEDDEEWPGGEVNVVYLYEPGILTASENPIVQSSRLQAGPNPATDFINFDLSRFEAGNYTVTLVDELGNVVYNINITEQNLTLPTANMSDGIYLAKISGENVLETLKIVVR